MKRITLTLLLLLLFAALACACAETPLDAVPEKLSAASSVDEQLAILYDASVEHASVLETEGWDVSLTCAPAEALPAQFCPSLEEVQAMETAEWTVGDLAGAKFIAVYNDNGEFSILGDFQARLPQEMRAASLEEADAVLYFAQYFASRSDYTGPASNRHYQAYVFCPGENVASSVYYMLSQPPMSGYGHLTGESIAMNELWSELREWFYGEMVLEYPEGTATYMITGADCCLSALDGEFVRYEIPAEVNGYPVTGIQKCESETLEELILPEGITWIREIRCYQLRKINFPSTLTCIEGRISVDNVEPLELNEGLQELGEFAIMKANGENFKLPSTLTEIGKGTLEYGVECPYIVVPEGVTRINEYFLNQNGLAQCVYIPESVQSIGDGVFDSGRMLIYTPADSYAASWAEWKGYRHVDCASAADMPEIRFAEENGFKYAIVENEAYLVRYTGSEDIVIVPDQLGGCPVTRIAENSFYYNDTVWKVVLPETLRTVEAFAFTFCPDLDDIYIKSSIVGWDNGDLISHCGSCIVHISADSVLWEHYNDYYRWVELAAGEADALGVEKEIIAADGYDVGDIVTMGHYGGEAVEWLVLAAEGDTRTMITVKGQDAVCYYEIPSNNTWTNIYIRQWLNDTYYNTAFSADEQAMIVPGSTHDNVWLLSLAEAKRYFASDEARVCCATEYAKNNGAYTMDNGAAKWWLRSTGSDSYSAAQVFSDGEIGTNGFYVTTDDIMARPVVVIRVGQAE